MTAFCANSPSGYDPVVFDYDENGIRHLREVKLWEISVVTWGNERTGGHYGPQIG